MSTTDSRALRDLTAQPNPYTDADPLVVRDHPWLENRIVLIIAAVVALMALAPLVVRAASGLDPAFNGQAKLALFIGLPLAAVIALYPLLLASRVKVRVGASTLTREIAARRGTSKSIALASIRGGIYASHVRYRRDTGKELVLFLPDREIIWIADGLQGDDVARVAQALSSCGIREYVEPITSEKLQSLVTRARRMTEDGDQTSG